MAPVDKPEDDEDGARVGLPVLVDVDVAVAVGRADELLETIWTNLASVMFQILEDLPRNLAHPSTSEDLLVLRRCC